jgi:hypothetical protein
MKTNTHHNKQMAKLRYQEDIMNLHYTGKSIREITQIINNKLIRSRLKTKLSKSTIHTIITNNLTIKDS